MRQLVPPTCNLPAPTVNAKGEERALHDTQTHPWCRSTLKIVASDQCTCHKISLLRFGK